LLSVIIALYTLLFQFLSLKKKIGYTFINNRKKESYCVRYGTHCDQKRSKKESKSGIYDRKGTDPADSAPFVPKDINIHSIIQQH